MNIQIGDRVLVADGEGHVFESEVLMISPNGAYVSVRLHGEPCWMSVKLIRDVLKSRTTAKEVTHPSFPLDSDLSKTIYAVVWPGIPQSVLALHESLETAEEERARLGEMVRVIGMDLILMRRYGNDRERDS